MKGLEEIYYDLDGIRRRLVRLVEMERLTREEGMELMPPVLALSKKVEVLMTKYNVGDEGQDKDITVPKRPGFSIPSPDGIER